MYTSDQEDLICAKYTQQAWVAQAQQRQLLQQIGGPSLTQQTAQALGAALVAFGRWLQCHARRQQPISIANDLMPTQR
ncbi:hypothetical protein F8S13_16930 [Chloroflexia bacterium SDU3-3]|nr:hypothetical protein F8S13_16930 [Chloroflexia bacterium SDU3-3]